MTVEEDQHPRLSGAATTEAAHADADLAVLNALRPICRHTLESGQRLIERADAATFEVLTRDHARGGGRALAVNRAPGGGHLDVVLQAQRVFGRRRSLRAFLWFLWNLSEKTARSRSNHDQKDDLEEIPTHASMTVANQKEQGSYSRVERRLSFQ